MLLGSHLVVQRSFQSDPGSESCSHGSVVAPHRLHGAVWLSLQFALESRALLWRHPVLHPGKPAFSSQVHDAAPILAGLGSVSQSAVGPQTLL